MLLFLAMVCHMSDAALPTRRSSPTKLYQLIPNCEPKEEKKSISLTVVLVFQQNTWGVGGRNWDRERAVGVVMVGSNSSEATFSDFHFFTAGFPLALFTFFRPTGHFCGHTCLRSCCTSESVIAHRSVHALFFFQWIASINYSLFRKVDEKLKLERSQPLRSWLWTWPHISSADCLKAVLALHTQCLMLQNHSIEVCQLKTSLHFFISWWSSLSS